MAEVSSHLTPGVARRVILGNCVPYGAHRHRCDVAAHLARLVREARARKRPRVPEWIDNEFVENSDEEYAFAMQEAAARSWTPPAHAPSLSPASSSPPSSPRAAGAGELAPQTGDAALAPTSDKALPTLRPPRDLLFLMDSDDE